MPFLNWLNGRCLTILNRLVPAADPRGKVRGAGSEPPVIVPRQGDTAA